jgi:hypothetical protein
LNRRRLREALRTRDGSAAAVVPLIWRHAARLEQVPEDRLVSDAETVARCLRNAQSLYDLDAVTLGADVRAVVTAAASAAGHVADSSPPPELPAPARVVEAPALTVLREALRRLRPVLRERAGTAVVLPDPVLLAARVGVPQAIEWAGEVLLEAVRFFGAEEPDLFLLAGGSHPPAESLTRAGDFFGAGLVAIGVPPSPGVAHISDRLFAGEDGEALEGLPESGVWLYTTPVEVDAAADPAHVKKRLAELRLALERGESRTHGAKDR